MSERTYIGDGVYAAYDGYHVILTTEHPTGQHVIFLDPVVIRALADFAKKSYESAETTRPENAPAD